jgi:quercetin dioxygenase-like cupin family protein
MRYFIAAILGTIIAVTAANAQKTIKEYQRERVAPLASGDRTIVDEPISYPGGGAANIKSLILTMQPGEETGWHTHGVPLFVYMLDGEIQTDYGPKGVRTYKKGDSLLEALTIRHNSTNKGQTPARLLVVFMGAQGYENVAREKTTSAP